MSIVVHGDIRTTNGRLFCMPVTTRTGRASTCLVCEYDFEVLVPGRVLVPFPNPFGGGSMFSLPLSSLRSFCNATEEELGKDMEVSRDPTTPVTNECHVVALCSSAQEARRLCPDVDDAEFGAFVPVGFGAAIVDVPAGCRRDGCALVFPGHHAFFPCAAHPPRPLDVVCYGFNMCVRYFDADVEDDQVLDALRAAFQAPHAKLRVGDLHRVVAVVLQGPLTNTNLVGRCTVALPSELPMAAPDDAASPATPSATPPASPASPAPPAPPAFPALPAGNDATLPALPVFEYLPVGALDLFPPVRLDNNGDSEDEDDDGSAGHFAPSHRGVQRQWF